MIPTHIYIADMGTKEVSKCTELLNEAFLVKIANNNNYHAHVAWIPLVSVFWGSGVVSGIRGKQNDSVASERSIFSENHDYNFFFRVAVNTYVPIFRSLDARGGRKLRTDTHTRDNYSNPRCAHARRGLTSARVGSHTLLLYGRV